MTIYKTVVARNEVSGEFNRVGRLTRLEGLTQEQIEHVLARGFYVIWNPGGQDEAITEDAQEAADDCAGC